MIAHSANWHFYGFNLFSFIENIIAIHYSSPFIVFRLLCFNRKLQDICARGYKKSCSAQLSIKVFSWSNVKLLAFKYHSGPVPPERFRVSDFTPSPYHLGGSVFSIQLLPLTVWKVQSFQLHSISVLPRKFILFQFHYIRVSSRRFGVSNRTLSPYNLSRVTPSPYQFGG